MSPALRQHCLPGWLWAMTQQGEAWGSGLPTSPVQGRKHPGPEPRLPPGRVGALWPGGGPGRCVVAAGGGGAAAGREGGGKIAALPLAAGSLAASGDDGGSGGTARLGASRSPAPLRPTRRGPWLPGGGLGAASPRDRAPGPRDCRCSAGWAGLVPSRRGGGPAERYAEPAWARRGLALFGGLRDYVGRRSGGTPALRETGGRVKEGAPPLDGAAGTRWREQREPVWPEGRDRPRGEREPCLDGAGPPRRERGSLSRLGCS